MANKKPDMIQQETVRCGVTKYILHFNIENTLILEEDS